MRLLRRCRPGRSRPWTRSHLNAWGRGLPSQQGRPRSPRIRSTSFARAARPPGSPPIVAGQLVARVPCPLPRPLSSGVVPAGTACISRGTWPSCGGQARCHPDTLRSPCSARPTSGYNFTAPRSRCRPMSSRHNRDPVVDHHYGRSHRAACLTGHRVIAISYKVSDGEVDATCSQVVRRSRNLDRRRRALPPTSSAHARSAGCDEAEHDSPAG